MALFDDILSQVSGNPQVANMASKLGIDPDMAERAVAALAQAHQQPGDTVQQAAETSGIDSGTLSQIAEHLGGEGALGHITSMLGQGGEGGALDGIAGFAKKFL